MEADFFNNACTVIPLLLPTKVAERARRRAGSSVGEWLHRCFIVIGFFAEGVAFAGAKYRTEGLALAVAILLAVSVVLLLVELALNEQHVGSG